MNKIKTQQLESFAKYLTLPWHNLDKFTHAVKRYEDEFQRKLIQVGSSNHQSLIHIEQFPFHIFNHKVSHEPSFLLRRLKLHSMTNDVVQLLKENDRWKDLKDIDNNSINSDNAYLFIQGLTSRLLNFNFFAPPSTIPLQLRGYHNVSKEHITGYETFLPKLKNIDYRVISEEKSFIASRKYEVFFHVLNPKNIFASKAPTPFLEPEHFNVGPEKEDHVKNHMVYIIKHFILPIFNSSILPIIDKRHGSGTNLRLKSNSEATIDTFVPANSNFELSTVSWDNEDCLNVFDQTLQRIPARLDICLNLRESKVLEPFKILLFELKFESEIGSLVKWYVNTRKNGVSLKDKQAVKDFKRIHKFIQQITSYLRMTGVRTGILTNGDELITFYCEDFYVQKRNNESNPKLFNDWKVVVSDAQEKSMIITLSSIILEECKGILQNGSITNTEIANWNITHGSTPEKKNLDMVRYLISRKLFGTMFLNTGVPFSETDIDLFGFKWSEVVDLEKLGLTEEILDSLIQETSELVKNTGLWKVLKGEEELITHDNNPVELRQEGLELFKNLQILESSDFTVTKVLQNEMWCQDLGSTTISGKYNDVDGIIKIFDLNRMSCSHTKMAHFRNGLEFPQSFRENLKISYYLFLNELIAYDILNNLDFIPKLLNSGFLNISELKPTSLNKDIKMYENPFVKTPDARRLKTQSLFLFMENAESISVQELKKVDFNLLRDQAFIDLDHIHKMGIRHRDISHKNIIIKKSDKTKHGYRIVFFDFGQSIVSGKKPRKEFKTWIDVRDINQEDKEIDLELKEKDKSDLESAIDYYQDLALQ